MADLVRQFFVGTTGNDYYPGLATYGTAVTTIAASEVPSPTGHICRIRGILVVALDATGSTINVGYASGSDAATYPLNDIALGAAASYILPFWIPLGDVMMPGGLPAAKTSDSDTDFIVFWLPD